MASQVEENADLPAGFLNDEDGRFTAETLYGSPSDENLDKVKRGNGMIVNFERGKGEVFHAGSCEWVAGLLRSDAMVEKVTKNVLDICWLEILGLAVRRHAVPGAEPPRRTCST